MHTILIRGDMSGYVMRVIILLPVFVLFFVYTGSAQLNYEERDIPVRDGATLKADIYIGGAGEARPVILVQTPYNKMFYRFSLGRAGSTFPLDTAWYHYVFVDWRGFYASRDAAVAGYDRGLDGYDIIDWIAKQPWCNGKVGTFGGSALGLIQFLTARHQPPNLVCAAPSIIDYLTQYSDYFFHGVLRTEHVNALERLGFYPAGLIASRPVENLFWDVIQNQSDYPEDIAVPLLMCSGWYDHYPSEVLRAFSDLRQRSAAEVRDAHKLIMGPWTHAEVDLERQGELRFPEAAQVFRDAALQFFAYYLLDAKNGWPLQPALRYFQMGENEWKSLDDWSRRPAIPYQLHLHSDATLSDIPPGTSAQLDLPYDPRDPSPSHGGARFDPFDLSVVAGPLDISRIVEARGDARLFTSAVLSSPVAMAGQVEVTLTLSSDRRDTDIAVRLCDVHPDGRSIILSDGIRRMRFRAGTRAEALLEPGVPSTTSITMPDLAHTFGKGHRIRLVVTSSNWPRFDRNLNNGGAMYAPGDSLIANNTLHFGPMHSAYIGMQLSSPLVHVGNVKAPLQHSAFRDIYPQPWTRSGAPLSIGLTVSSSHPTLEIIDALGRAVAGFDVSANAGYTSLHWDGRDSRGRLVPSGIYIARLIDGPVVLYRRLLLVGVDG
jgi:uncharacterized protein